MDAQAITAAARDSFAGARPFPQIVQSLLAAGVSSYHVDYAARRTTHYGDGAPVVVPIPFDLPPVAPAFDAAALVAAIRDSQRGALKYPDFCRRAVAAGVLGYHAFLDGRRVTYYGRGGDSHTEWFPGVPRPKDVVAAWVEAFNRADPDALAAFYAEDAVNHQVAETPVQGRAAIRAMFAAGFAAAKMVCLVENLFEDGEWAILEWRDPLGLRGCGFFHVREGKIVFQRGYWDKLSFQKLHGLAPDH